MSKYWDNYFKIALAIKEYRKALCISQEELADRIGVSLSYISKIEAPNCNKTFSLEVVFDIAEALKVPVTSFFKYIYD